MTTGHRFAGPSGSAPECAPQAAFGESINRQAQAARMTAALSWLADTGIAMNLSRT